MKINVTENKVSIKEEQILNENEYNIHKIQFDFSSEYTDDLVKVALFSIDNHTYKKIISNNECDIPPEVLTKRGYSILGVYAYKTEQDTLVLRYSPSPTRISVYDGSYKAEAENSEPITPSEIEQYQQILQNSLQQFQNQYNTLVEETEGDIQAIEDELQRKVDEGYFDGEDGFSPIAKVIQKSNGATIEIEDKNGKTTADVLNGEDGYTPVRGVDYWTEEDKQEVKEEATQQIEGKIEEYNENAAEKLNQYNQNSVQKTNDYNTNAEQKMSAYNTNASQKVESFNTNANNKLSEYNSNAETKKTAYDENATQKTNSFNTNATNKLTEYNTNHTEKMSAYNSNNTEKLNAFNENAVQKTEDFDEHTEEIQESIENLQTGKEDKTNKVTSIDENSTDIQYPSAKTVYDELTKRDERITALENTSGHIYGVKRKITNNSSSSWERLFDSIGKTAAATKNGGTVQNDFDNLAPWSEIKTCNYDLETKKIKAWIGDANFKFDGTNGDVFTHIPKTYWKIYQEDDYDYVLLADYPKAGFMEIDGFFVGRYNGSVVDDVLHTYSGLVPTTSKNRGQFRTLANALGNNFSQLDWRYLVLQMLYLVEYATYNSQSALGNGVQNRKNVKAIVAETGVNRVIVGSSSGYYVGQIIRIGTTDRGTQVADARKITAIEAYDEDGVTGAALTFDGAAVNIAVDNFVCTMAQETGQCDNLGMKSGCLNNDGYHAVIYRGVENIFANVWQFMDGINIKDNVAYICKEHSEYISDKFETPYKALGYTNINANGYAKTLGLDVDEPFFRFPTEVGGSTSTYMADYYYQNTGNRIARVGGDFTAGASDGLWSWYFGSSSSVADWSVGCRVLIDNQ